MRSPPLVVFDAAGTLVELDRRVGAVYAELMREAGGLPDAPERIEARFVEACREAPPLAFGRTDPAAERAWWREVAARSIGHEASRLPPPSFDFERFFDRAYAWFARAEAWRFPADVRPALRALRRRGHPLAVLSNWDSRLPALLRALGVEGYFAAIVVSSELPDAKPSTKAFVAARLRLGDLTAGVPPVMVGDRIANDVTPALEAGWEAVWLDRARRGGAPEGVRTITTLIELGELL